MTLRTRLALVGGVVVLVVAYLMVSGFSAGKVYYHTVDEFAAQQDALEGQFVRVSGVVLPGTVDWQPTQVRLEFTLGSAEGGQAAVPVVYDRVKPDLLADDVPVVVEGRMGADGVFHAERVLVKCPSKYEAAAAY
ncbi:MAG: cytochrome c maturation protein CcmE [Thermaerobacter sp.]|nr:cytochrome c biogenesis protein CcmE [Bacillota bacterium]REJ32052.1 MAG: cytochrome c biogenesis protein CcmE [Bacillota bacterium]